MINLVKGQTIDLSKKPDGGTHNLSEITIGLGWDISRNKSSYDLDAVAVLLDKNGKIASSDDVVYYGNKTHKSGKVWSTGDNLTGDGDGDDEQIIVKLSSIDEKYDKIVFFTSIYQGESKRQTFGDIRETYIRAVDAGKNEIAKYKISGDNTLSSKRSFVFGEAYRKDGAWKFRALGEALDTDSWSKVCESYK